MLRHIEADVNKADQQRAEEDRQDQDEDHRAEHAQGSSIIHCLIEFFLQATTLGK